MNRLVQAKVIDLLLEDLQQAVISLLDEADNRAKVLQIRLALDEETPETEETHTEDLSAFGDYIQYIIKRLK